MSPRGRPLATPLTVQAALRETALVEAELVAGRQGLSRRIEGVAVLDVADFESVRPHDLVLVNAYALLETNLSGLVRRLVARDAAGFGVKLDPYWDRMPPALVESAEAARLPLMALPSGRFEDMVNPLLATIVDRQARALRGIADFHRALTDAALEDNAWDATADVLARGLGADAAIFDQEGELLGASAGASGWAEQLGGTDRLALDGVVERDGERVLVVPILARGRRYGAIVVRGIDTDDALARAVTAEAAVVTGMQILGRRHVEIVHRRFEREFLDDLVGRRVEGSAARERAERLGWPVRRPYVVVYAIPGPSRELLLGEQHLPAVDRGLRGEFFARAFRHRGGLAVVVHFARSDDPRTVAEKTAARLRRIRNVPLGDAELTIGASRATSDLGRLPDATREARLAVAMPPPLRRAGDTVVHFDDLGAARLLATIRRTRLVQLAQQELEPLGDPADPATRELTNTLAALLTTNMHVGRSAEELFFHYNTVRHRLGRIRELLHGRLDDPEQQAVLWLAVLGLQIAELDRRAA